MRLRYEALAAAGALALLVLMFLGWFTHLTTSPSSGTGAAGGESQSAWEAFAVTDLLLLLAALLALALAVATVTQRAPALPVGLGVLTLSTALIAGLVLLYRILNEPGPDDLVEVRISAWLGLLALALTGAGAWLALEDEGPRPGDPVAVDVERRSAPPA
jgi:hypothetical protein